jgi:hypothetical protein
LALSVRPLLDVTVSGPALTTAPVVVRDGPAYHVYLANDAANAPLPVQLDLRALGVPHGATVIVNLVSKDAHCEVQNALSYSFGGVPVVFLVARIGWDRIGEDRIGQDRIGDTGSAPLPACPGKPVRIFLSRFPELLLGSLWMLC